MNYKKLKSKCWIESKYDYADALRDSCEKNTNLYPLVFSDETEFMEAAFTVEKEAIKVAIDTTVAILCGHQFAILNLVDGCVWIRKNDG